MNRTTGAQRHNKRQDKIWENYQAQLNNPFAAKLKRLRSLSNEDLVRTINGLPDFGWDDEGNELSQRIDAGTIKVEMQGNTLVIIQ